MPPARQEAGRPYLSRAHVRKPTGPCPRPGRGGGRTGGGGHAVQARARRFPGSGDPAATRDAVLLLVDTPNPPLRMFLGEAPLGIATADYESRLAIWREWQPVAAGAQNCGN